MTGTRPSHSHLEEAIGAWLNRDRVLLYPSGFQANLAALSALADRHTTVIADRLIHHSLLVGIRASGARLIRYRHNDIDHLAQRLRQAKPPRGGDGKSLQHGGNQSGPGGDRCTLRRP